MSKYPLISVIMATYNHEAFVSVAIDSVLNQKNVNFEFLISDDGSNDNTANVVRKYNDSRIKFFENKINRGACTVTNELIQKASGKYIALMNSDDIWNADNKLEIQIKYMLENPKIGACFGKVAFINKDGSVINKSTLSFGSIFEQDNRSQGRWLRRFFEHGNCLCHPTILIKKECYTKLGMYNNRFRQLPDLDMWVRLVKHYPIHIIDKEFILFRITPGENTSSQTVPNSIRTMNEHYLIGMNFFDDVSFKIFLEGFSDLMRIKDKRTKKYLDIEKVLIYFHLSNELGKAYNLIGLYKLKLLLGNESYNNILNKIYKIDDTWFQKRMADVDTLRPKMTAIMQQHKSTIRKILNKLKIR